MKSICFLFTKKRAIISCIAAADMKLIIALHRSKTCNAPSLRLDTCMWSNSWKIYCQNKPQNNSLTAPSHSLLARHQEACHPRHLHLQNQSWEKAHEAYMYGKSLQVYLFLDIWFWQCHLSRSNHEWDHCTSTFCSCRQLTHSWVSDSHLQKFLYFA